jgi:hypothetical protein
MGDASMPHAATKPAPAALWTVKTVILALGLTALTACEPPNKHPEPIGGPYWDKLSGAWSPRDPKEPCPAEKVKFLVGNFTYDMSPFCSVAYVLF